jgi:FdhE protein
VSVETDEWRVTEGDLDNLQRVSESNPDLEPLVSMQCLALRAIADERLILGSLASVQHVQPEVPLLHEATIGVDLARLHDFVRALAAHLPESNDGEARLLKRAQAADPGVLVHAAVTHDEASIERLARERDVDSSALGLIAQLAALPLLVSCAQHLTSTATMPEWQQSYCPICGAWPMLAEMRGLEREYWLRCGRCSSGWRYAASVCVFCGEDRHEQLSYLAPEAERESRRAMTCEQCHGYLKSFATLGPLSLTDILARDLSSIVLDVAALEEGYARPSLAGYKLDVRLEPIRRSRLWWLS